MKVLTKEEEDAHYAHTLRGGLAGGALGVGLGIGTALLLQRRSPFFRSLTLPFKAFFVTSAGTFAAIISGDRASRGFEASLHPDTFYVDRAAQARQAALANQSFSERIQTWGRENRYTIVGVSWLASMGLSLGLVAKDKYLSRSQKIVQARVYAQGLTLAVLIASAAFEVSDARNPEARKADTVMVPDPSDPTGKRMIEKKVHHEAYKGEDLWMDMVESEERKMKAREAKKEEARKKTEAERQSQK